MVMVENGRASVVVQGETDRAGCAYAVVDLDEICAIPLARSRFNRNGRKWPRSATPGTHRGWFATLGSKPSARWWSCFTW